MSTFGIYARNILASQCSEPDQKPESQRPEVLKEYDKHQAMLHIAKQPCPGSCRNDVCINTTCQSHPETYYFLKELLA